MFSHARRQSTSDSAPFVRPHDASSAFADQLSDDAGRPVRISMLGRPGCHLCDQVRVGLREVQAQTGESFVEANIDEHPELLGKYGEWIPVVFLDGRQFDYYRLDVPRLVAALTKR